MERLNFRLVFVKYLEGENEELLWLIFQPSIKRVGLSLRMVGSTDKGENKKNKKLELNVQFFIYIDFHRKKLQKVFFCFCRTKE